MRPKLLKGNKHEDSRGFLYYNNDFDGTAIKRIYVIENQSAAVVRSWRGHAIEHRWFSAMSGSFKITLIAIDNWENPLRKLKSETFNIDAETMDILHIPAGYVSSIQSIEEGSKLLVMADYFLGELEDDYRFEADYFD